MKLANAAMHEAYAATIHSLQEPPHNSTDPPVTRESLDGMRLAQHAWAALATKRRLRVLRQARYAIAQGAQQLAATVPTNLPGHSHRTLADTLVAEVLPLLDACRFLEREAERILLPRKLGVRGRPFWLSGVNTVIHRVPVGVVLILAPGNYPLFLPGVQALQALAAGNAVLWKPAPGGAEAAHAFNQILVDAGLDPRLMNVLDDSVEAGIEALDLEADKVFLTGSAATGQAVLRSLAETLTPSVMELSGCDAVFLLDGIDEGSGMDRAIDAIVFGLRLNGSATCMAPRRIFATAAVTERVLPRLVEQLSKVRTIPVPVSAARKLNELIEDAVDHGATVALDGRISNQSLAPTVLDRVHVQMLATKTDIFAPLLSFIHVADEEEALAAYAQCPYALTASVFGPPEAARALAARIGAGHILINDVIVSTADPRAPFGGRRRSGFGATRGREGLLEMTAVKTVQSQGSGSRRPYQPTTPLHAEFFLGMIRTFHGRGLAARWRGVRQLFRTARLMK